MKNKKGKRLYKLYFFFKLFRSLTLTEEKRSTSGPQIQKIHFWTLSITYYLVKMSLKYSHLINIISVQLMWVYLNKHHSETNVRCFDLAFISSLSFIAHIHSITMCYGFYLWTLSQKVFLFLSLLPHHYFNPSHNYLLWIY